MSITVKRVIYREHGDPEKVISLDETVIDTSKLAASEVLVHWLAAPINPSDLSQISGGYATNPSAFPATPGNEGVGVVEKTGPAVKDLKVGDYVIPGASALGTWRTHAVYESSQLYPIPFASGLPTMTLATLLVNPPTAYRLLKDFVQLKQGDVVVQNGGNSAVGRYVIQLCHLWGVKTVNVVRDRSDIDSLKKELKALGADEVFTEEEFKAARVELKNVRLALDCVGGESSLHLSTSLAPRGILINYGSMSGKPVQASPSDLIFKDIRVRGFWRTQWYKEASFEIRTQMFKELIALIKEGKLKDPPHEERRLEDFAAAVKESRAPGSSKQILVLPAGQKEASRL